MILGIRYEMQEAHFRALLPWILVGIVVFFPRWFLETEWALTIGALATAIILWWNLSSTLSWVSYGFKGAWIPLVSCWLALYINVVFTFAYFYQLSCIKFALVDFENALCETDIFIALAFSVTTITTLGYGNYVPASNATIIGAMIQASVGFLLFSLLGAQVAASLVITRVKLLKNTEIQLNAIAKRASMLLEMLDSRKGTKE